MIVTCAFTGHRPGHYSFGGNEHAPGCVRLKAIIAQHIGEMAAGATHHFLSGMAQGADLWAAEAVLALRERAPQLRLTAVLPCADQAARWQRPMRDRYEAVLARCDEVVTLLPEYAPGCMQARNRWLVENCHIMYAVYDGSPKGGTAYTVQYAIRKSKPVMIVDPETLQIRHA